MAALKSNPLADLLPAQLPQPVVIPGEFVCAAVGLDHGHIDMMCAGLVSAGATLGWIYDRDPVRARQLAAKHPGARLAPDLDTILRDPVVRLVATAAIPDERAALGRLVMNAGKDFFSAKPPFTSLLQLAEARELARSTGRIHAVYYSERLQSESALFAGAIIAAGLIGRVVQVSGFGPHRLNAAARPDWFFDPARQGGILGDLGSHQFDQFLHYTGNTDATVTHALVANHATPARPAFEDYGEASLLGANGATCSIRVDWLNPDGARVWGDSRTMILGTDGYLELRKSHDLCRDPGSDHVYLVNHQGEHHLQVAGRVGFSYFGQLIRDCLDRTCTAMSPAHTFKAAELALLAQQQARRL